MSGNRPEARSLSWDTLSASQQEAIERISQCLLDALADLNVLKRLEHEGRLSDDGLDPLRASRIFFLSGEPGSGKTTTYLSIRKILGNDSADIQKGKKNLQELWGKQEQLVWLKPLDLEPAAEPTNFLAAILVRIQKAIEQTQQKPGEESRKPGLLEHGSGPLQGLQRLQNDIVLAWDGNIPARAAHADPDTYSVEILRAETARLNVNSRLHETLGNLVRRKGKSDALFVLPVDDFYLKPASSLQFLRLLRMISVPRLFILVLGDLDVVEELFYQDILGELVALAGESTFSVVKRQEMILTSRAGSLASHALRKLVPLAQRNRLEVMEELQALNFSFRTFESLLPEASRRGDSRTLRDLFKRLPVQLNPVTAKPTKEPKLHPRNLYDFLLVRDEKAEAPEGKKKFEPYTYSGLGILDLPPREVVDLWSSAADTVDSIENGDEPDESWSATIELVIQQAQESLAGQTFLSRVDQSRFEEAIQGNVYSKRIFETKDLEMSSEERSVQTLHLLLGGAFDGGVLAVSTHEGWALRPHPGQNFEITGSGSPAGRRRLSRSGSAEHEKGINYLPPRPTAWFTVLHDLMALSEVGQLKGGPLTPRPFTLPWVRISWRDSKEALCWPTPAWPSFWHFDRFAFAWAKVTGRQRGGESLKKLDPARLAYCWIRFITSIITPDRSHFDAPLAVISQENKKRDPWSELAKPLASNRQERNWGRQLLACSGNGLIGGDGGVTIPAWRQYRKSCKAT